MSLGEAAEIGGAGGKQEIEFYCACLKAVVTGGSMTISRFNSKLLLAFRSGMGTLSEGLAREVSSEARG